MRFKRLIAIIRKETLHILRDRTSFLLTLLSPVFLLITMAYAFSVEVREVAVASRPWMYWRERGALSISSTATATSRTSTEKA